MPDTAPQMLAMVLIMSSLDFNISMACLKAFLLKIFGNYESKIPLEKRSPKILTTMPCLGNIYIAIEDV